MDKGHELAFINQNFNNIASVIQQNSFVIVKSDTIAYSFSGGNSSFRAIPHGLPFIPIPLAFLGTSTSFYRPLPTWLGIGYTVSGVVFNTWIDCDVDATNLNLYANYATGNFGSGLFIKYYLLQQTAN